MNSQKTLTDSGHNRALTEARAETMKDYIVKLRRQLEERQSNDDMFALRAQLDVYKADFEAKREGKEEVKRDKIKIAEDLQHLTRRNQQLQEEVEILPNRLHEDVSQASSTSNSSPVLVAPRSIKTLTVSIHLLASMNFSLCASGTRSTSFYQATILSYCVFMLRLFWRMVSK